MQLPLGLIVQPLPEGNLLSALHASALLHWEYNLTKGYRSIPKVHLPRYKPEEKSSFWGRGKTLQKLKELSLVFPASQANHHDGDWFISTRQNRKFSM